MENGSYFASIKAYENNYDASAEKVPKQTTKSIIITTKKEVIKFNFNACSRKAHKVLNCVTEINILAIQQRNP